MGSVNVLVEAHSVYAAGDTKGLFLVLSSKFAVGLQGDVDQYEADMMCVHPGTYRIVSHPRSTLEGKKTLIPKSTRGYMGGPSETCNVLNITKESDILEGHQMKESLKDKVTAARASYTHEPSRVLHVPAGMNPVLLNPASTHSFWKQLLIDGELMPPPHMTLYHVTRYLSRATLAANEQRTLPCPTVTELSAQTPEGDMFALMTLHQQISMTGY